MVLLYLNIFSCPGYLGDIINTRVGGQGLEFNNDTTEYLTFWQRELTLECKTSIFFYNTTFAILNWLTLLIKDVQVLLKASKMCNYQEECKVSLEQCHLTYVPKDVMAKWVLQCNSFCKFNFVSL